MIFRLREPHRRTDRHGDRARIENQEEDDEEIDAGRERQGNAIIWHVVLRRQARHNDERRVDKFTIDRAA